MFPFLIGKVLTGDSMHDDLTFEVCRFPFLIGKVLTLREERVNFPLVSEDVSIPYR